jgi:hypothetical protein
VGGPDYVFAESELVMTRSNMEGAPHIAPSTPATQVSGKEKDQIAQAVMPSRNPIEKPPPKNLSLKQLINTINHINFQDLNITVVFQHNKYQRVLNLQAYPLPCQD